MARRDFSSRHSLPQSVQIRHDALYRVVGAEYDYTQRDRSHAPTDLATDWRDEHAATRTVDPMREEPAQMVPAPSSGRVVDLNWTYDYLANSTEWNDDAARFYERSIGDITNGDDVGPGERPSALYLASNIGDGTGLGDGGGGWLEVEYGVGGNVLSMVVRGQCGVVDACVDPGGVDLDARRSALLDCECVHEQYYEYRWDELNRLAEARRYDRIGVPRWELQVRQRYRYDGANQRTVKQTLDEEGCGTGPMQTPCERTALYVYPGDFERRGLRVDGDEWIADDVLGTETQYLVAGARWVQRVEASGAGSFDREQRLSVNVTDLIQTTAAVMDVRSGALMESSTYYPNGGRETSLGDADARAPPEVSGFTGKEADEEVGVVYFGERYLVSRIGRWASPDPLHVHAVGGGETLNSYHYVSGSLLVARDPLGLETRVSATHITPEANVRGIADQGLRSPTPTAAALDRSGWWFGRGVYLNDASTPTASFTRAPGQEGRVVLRTSVDIEDFVVVSEDQVREVWRTVNDSAFDYGRSQGYSEQRTRALRREMFRAYWANQAADAPGLIVNVPEQVGRRMRVSPGRTIVVRPGHEDRISRSFRAVGRVRWQPSSSAEGGRYAVRQGGVGRVNRVLRNAAAFSSGRAPRLSRVMGQLRRLAPIGRSVLTVLGSLGIFDYVLAPVQGIELGRQLRDDHVQPAIRRNEDRAQRAIEEAELGRCSATRGPVRGGRVCR